MKKILIFARDPGGVNTIIPLIPVLKKHGFSLLVYGKDVALKKFQDSGIFCKNILAEIADITSDTIHSFFKEKMVDLVLTGTSADDMVEKFLWQSAEELNIPSMAILDQWINYGLRFSKYGVSELDKFNLDKELVYLPTRICVMDSLAKAEAMEEGIEEKRLVITGQPYFETVLKNGKRSRESVNSREKYGFKNSETVVGFVSEPISETYNETDLSTHYWGYTERTVFKTFLDSLEEMARDEQIHEPIIYIKHHPKEKTGNFNDIIRDNRHYCKIVTQQDGTVWDFLNTVDIVVGMSSMLLLEAALLEKKVMSLQPGLCKKDPFVLSRMGAMKTMTEKNEFKGQIEKQLNKKSSLNKFEFIKDPVERIIREIKKLWES